MDKPLVKDIKDVEKNIRKLNSYRLVENSKDYEFYKEMIKGGRHFVVLKTDGSFLYAPSRFAGYQNNNRCKHLKTRGSGTDTTKVLAKIFPERITEGSKYIKLFRYYKALCKEYGIVHKKYKEPTSDCPNGRSFWLISQSKIDTLKTYHADLETAVQNSLDDSASQRKKRLVNAPIYPTKRLVSTYVYVRNSDVVAEVLVRANGSCEQCGSRAPFNRSNNGEPYLEVHHKVRLADGGADTLENTIAVCPNCHRQQHFGV